MLTAKDNWKNESDEGLNINFYIYLLGKINTSFNEIKAFLF